MHFTFGITEDLITPIGIDGSVTKFNPFFLSNDISPSADVNLNLSSIPSKRDEMDLQTLDKFKRMNDNQLDDEFLSSLEFTDFDDFQGPGESSAIFSKQNLTPFSSRSGLSMEDFRPEDYLPASSLASTGLDGPMSSFDEKSMFLPALDSTVDSDDSSVPPWVGEECTVGSGTNDDIRVSLDSPMPSVSSMSSASSSSAAKRFSKSPRLSTVDRRLRKKDQNKTAAEKYRQKKRTERDELAHRQSTLQNQNRELKFELENFTFRLEQFKQLFVDVLQIPLPPSKSK